MQRAFVTLTDASRQVHYRRAGDGPTLVYLHATPDSSAALNLTQPGRTVIALDTPGYGESAPLSILEPSMFDYADALIQTFDALDLDRVDIVGWGSGAVQAAAFAVRYPHRVASVRTEDPVSCSPRQRAWMLANYAPSLAPEWDGTHLLRAWMIRRDMHLFRPWFSRIATARLGANLPSSRHLHREFIDLLCAGEHWGDADRAAFRYDFPSGLRQPRAIDTRTTAAPPQVAVQRKSSGFTRDYAKVSFGQVHVWRAGPERGVPLLMLHASPGSSRAVLPLAERVCGERPVVVMDTPGFGESDPLDLSDPTIADFADAALEVIEALGERQVDLYGTHTGASIALEIAVRGPHRVRRVVFDGLPMFSSEDRADHLANYIPAFEVSWDGSHVVWAWNFIRNMTLFYPWYHMEAHHSTGRAPFTAMLHERALDLMKAGEHYAKGYRAVYRHEPRQALAQLAAEALLCVSAEDVLAPHAEAVRYARPDIRLEWLPSADRLAASHAAIQAFLA